MPAAGRLSVDLHGQTALVTGAGRGIGRDVALGLAEAGASVVLASRTRDELDAVRDAIRAVGGVAHASVADLSVEHDVTALFEGCLRECGRLDVLVNNAGSGRFGRLADATVAELEEVFSVNVRGTFLCCREAVKIMAPRRSGTIINIASVVGFRGYAEQSLYAASKHAVMGLTRSLALEAQEAGIRVSAVLPGGVDTDMIAAARPDLDRGGLLQPEDVTRCVLFLLSLPPRAAVDEIYVRRAASPPG